MLFSIVTLTYKRPELLEEAVYSVLQQTCKDWELLIINDCDSQIIQYDHPQVRIFNIKERFKTISDKRNFGLDNSIGDWILQLDDDDFLLPSYLDNLKNIIGPSEWLCSQRPIIYSDDVTKIYLSPVPQSNTFLCGRKVAEQFRYESVDTNELNPFYEKTEKLFGGKKRVRLLPPNQCGHVWRHGVDNRRKYSLTKFIEGNVAQNQWNNELGEVSGDSGTITLSPKWSVDYVSVIKNNMKFVDPQYAFNKIKGGKDLLSIADDAINEYKSKGTIQEEDSGSLSTKRVIEDPWTKVKPTWANALKFLEAAKSRGIVSTALNVVGIGVNTGERVSDDILKLRQLSCFGDASQHIAPCPRFHVVPDKGSFCGGCGCGDKNIARLDGDSPNSYTKLHYPQLECPLKRPGFSNEEKPVYLTTEGEIPFSIVIPVLNDNEELNMTIESIYRTSPSNIEVIVVDDFSDKPVVVSDDRVKLFRFNERKGAGQARHFGALNASSNHLLFIDSHMRFDTKWFNNAISRVQSAPKTLWCGACLGLDAKNMDISNPYGVYTGADLVLYATKDNTIFDGVWKPEVRDKDDYEVGCVMGACYFIHKDWYFHIRGLEKTKMWGSEEPILSLKTWLAGGEVRIMKSVKLGHKFRDSAPYTTPVSCINYNKLAYMYMTLPSDMYEKLKTKFPQDGNFQAALGLVEANKMELYSEKIYYKSIFVHDIYWLADKFKIELP